MAGIFFEFNLAIKLIKQLINLVLNKNNPKYEPEYNSTCFLYIIDFCIYSKFTFSRVYE